jgi:hypothetical protein
LHDPHLLRRVLLREGERFLMPPDSHLCGSNDTRRRFCILPLYSRIIFGWLGFPSETERSAQRDWGMIFEVSHGEDVRLHAEKTVL